MLSLAPFPVLSSLLFVVLGVVLGSFGNVLIIRLSSDRPITGRSACMRCKKILSALELIPLVSFFALGGRCRFCRKPISWQYPAVEAVSGILFVAALFQESFLLPQSLLLAFALWLLLLIAVIDAYTGLMSDALTLPFIAVSLFLAFLSPSFSTLAPLVGGGFFAFQWAVSRGKWVGSGDILFGLGIGLLLNRWDLLLVSLFVAYIGGSAVAIALIASGRKTFGSSLPFGPFLALGAVAALFWGEKILWAFV